MPVVAGLRGTQFGRSSLKGSGNAVMQLETVAARVARVAARPGVAEAWAIGLSNGRVEGWDQTSPSGQVVFLKHTTATGWTISGPPRDKHGRIFNPDLSSLAIGHDGGGWAVGDGGVILRKEPGSDVWAETSQSRTLTTATLLSVSLGRKAGGFAGGTGPTVLKLSGSAWTLDTVAPEMRAQTSELTAVAAVDADEAYAIATGQVTGVDSTSLRVYRRVGGTWNALQTGQAIFDNPPARSSEGGLNKAAEAGSIAADATGAWIGGRMHPRTASAPDGDQSFGDASRAFVLRFDARASTWTSYCPDQYSDRTANGSVDLTRMCDEPFPTAPHHIAALDIVPGGDVFAGGLGLFRFSGGGWFREPNVAGYLISIAMTSNVEGFVASPGRSLGAGGLVRSSSTSIGRWTRTPRPSAMARWPQPQQQLLEAVAVAGDGSGKAIAVGQQGAGVIQRSTGWDSIEIETLHNLHATAWPDGGTVWAAGQRGIVLRLEGNRWVEVPTPTSASLFGMAFRTGTEGVAVGQGGEIIVYRDGVWTQDGSPTRSDLLAVAFDGQRYVAVGRNATVVEGTPGAWRLRSDATSLLRRGYTDHLPALNAVTASKGRVWAGGDDHALIVRDGGTWRNVPRPPQGTVLALAAAGDSLFASISPGNEKYRGEAPVAQRGTLMRLRDGRWTDIGLNRRATLLKDIVDSSGFEDPVLSIAAESEHAAWGVGGSPADVKDAAEGHFRAVQTSAVYRIDTSGDPAPPATAERFDSEGSGVAFAAFGESWCGTGLCSAAIGTGTMADEVALRIREEINVAAARPDGPKFVLFTGNMRRAGIPEELEQFRSYLKGFKVPVYGAPGNLDRFAGLNVGPQGGASSGSHDYWKSVFASMPQPWGEAPSKPFIRPVPFAVAPASSMARTHYAFDYVEDGKAKLRVVVLDSSTRSFGTASEQNPAEDQSAWFKSVVADARSLPTVVMMNQPTSLPANTQLSNWSIAAAQDFEATVTTTGVVGVIAGGPRMNVRDSIKAVVPQFIVGGGGAPLGRELPSGSASADPPSKLPTDGYYHAWHLMHVDASKPTLLTPATLSDEVYPVIESVAVHSRQGSEIPAGRTAELSAFARGLNGGFSDPEQAKAAYLVLGRQQVRCGYKDQGNGYCVSDSTLLPRFRFVSLAPEIADFVRPSPFEPSEPLKIDGIVQMDPGGAAGLLCGFKPGRAPIEVIAGMRRAQLTITVGPGSGACTTEVYPTPPPTPEPSVEPPAPVPEKKPQIFFQAKARTEPVALFPPPPAPVVAPAPPGAPGVGRKEEHEVQTETEGHGDHSFTALVPQPRVTGPMELSWSPVLRSRANAEAGDARVAWYAMSAAVGMAFFGAVVAARVRERRRPAYREARWRP